MVATFAHLDAQEPGVMLALAQVRFASDRNDDAIVILQRAFELHPRADVAYVYAQALQKRGREADFGLALLVLLQISITDLRPELRPATVTNTIQCFAKKNDWQGAETYLAKVSDALDPAVRSMMKGYLAHHQGQEQEAQHFAAKARGLLTDNVNADTKESLARLFVLIGRPADALPLLQELFDKEVPGFDPRNLLTCAAKLDRDDLIMQTCQMLRARGVQDWNLVEFEVQYLEKYKIDDAIRVLQSFIASNSGSNRLAKLRLSFIGLRLNKPELVQARLQDLPPVQELPLHYATPAVQVLKYGGDPHEAIEYAYQFLRLHFADLEAHQAFIISMMPDASISKIPPSLDTAAVGTAVCYQEVPHGIPTWVVLEDTEVPNNDFEEVSLTSPVAIALMEKKPGRLLYSSKEQCKTARPRFYKYSPNMSDAIRTRWGRCRFALGQPVQWNPFTWTSLPTQIPERRRGYSRLCRSDAGNCVYLSRAVVTAAARLSHWYGTQFGSDAYQALMNLAAEDGQPVKCAQGSPVEREQALLSLRTAKEVIVDMSALATVRLLGLEKILSSTNFHFTVSERTWVTLQERLSHSKLLATPHGTLHFKDGRHVMYEETATEKEERIREDQEFIELLEKTCKVKAAPALAAIEPEKREALEKFFGSYGAESMVLASNPDSVLWTDDLIQAQTSAQEFGSRRVWTQIVLGAFTDLGLLTTDEYAEATARLLGMEFVATQFDSLSLLAALKLATWSASKRPAAQVLKRFRIQRWMLEPSSRSLWNSRSVSIESQSP
jgi:tetratricopeptide (TPR) repeat protein